MEAVKEAASFENVSDLKPLLVATPPCLTIYFPLGDASSEGRSPNPKQSKLRWKECLRGLEGKAAQSGPAGGELLESVRNLADLAPESALEGTGQTLVVFRSPDKFQASLLSQSLPERAVIGPHFFVRPLLADLVRDRVFYLLALSQKNTRLLRCDAKSSEAIPLPQDVKTDFEVWMNQVKPDHTAVYNAMTAGAQGASGPNALAPKGADQDAKDEYLSHFFKQVDRGVSETLKGKTEPLILCGVEYELPVYTEVNSYPHLAPEQVRGAPNGLKAGEMHARALEALERVYGRTIEDALETMDHRVGGGASTRLKEVVTAAHDGRVLTLLMSDAQETTGVFDEATHSVKAKETGTADDEDLVNDAAVQTILHAGNVLVVPHNKMPNGSPVAAIFRY